MLEELGSNLSSLGGGGIGRISGLEPDQTRPSKVACAGMKEALTRPSFLVAGTTQFRLAVPSTIDE